MVPIKVRSVEEAIAQHAAQNPHHTALVVEGGATMNYQQINEAINHVVQQLGDVKGHYVPFQATCSADSVVLYFAIHRKGGVAVPLDKDMPQPLFNNFKQQLAASSPCPIDTADVLFTTGTTGQPKGVIVSHKAMVANAENLIEAQGYHPSLTFVINGPLNHVGSLSKLYTSFLTGAVVSLIDGVKNIDRLLDVIEHAEESVATFLVPASIRMLMSFAANRVQQLASKIEFIETGAAPITQADMEQLCALLPTSRLFNTYASTETGIIATHNFNHTNACIAGCVGRAMRHSSISINEEGRVECSGDTLMTGYWNETASNAPLQPLDIISTNDLGSFDARGRLNIKGRIDDVINVGGYKIAPTEVEACAMDSGMVSDCICITCQHAIIGTVLHLLVVPCSKSFDKRQLYKWLKVRLEAYKLPQDIRIVNHVERTFNGKLNRKAYMRSM